MKKVEARPVILISRDKDGGCHVFAAENVTEKEIAMANVLVIMATGQRYQTI